MERIKATIRGTTCPVLISDQYRTNFDFQTPDSPEEVIAFYKSSLFKLYGFDGGWSENTSPDVDIFHIGRKALRSGPNCTQWLVESIDINASRIAGGQTKVTVDLNLIP